MPETADFLLERLREWGVHRVFGYPGDGMAEHYEKLPGRGGE